MQEAVEYIANERLIKEKAITAHSPYKKESLSKAEREKSLDHVQPIESTKHWWFIGIGFTTLITWITFSILQGMFVREALISSLIIALIMFIKLLGFKNNTSLRYVRGRQ